MSEANRETERLLSPQSKRVQEDLDASGSINLGRSGRRRGSALLAPLINTVTALKTERLRYVALFSFVACLGSLLIGMSLGYSATTGLELGHIYKDKDDKAHGIREDDDTLMSLFGGLLTLGAIFGAPLAWPFSDWFGRKLALMMGGIPTIFGWLLIAFAHFPHSRNGFLAMLFLGRALAGLGAGWLVFCVSVYITEIASEKLRGLFGASNQLFITIGIFVSYGLGAISIGNKDFHYYHVALIAAGIVLVFEVLMLFVKETPRWLIAHGKNLQANRVLNILRGPDANVPAEIEAINDAMGQEGFSVMEFFQQIRYRSVYLPMMLALLLMFFQQFSGINAAIFYAGSILKQAGISQGHSEDSQLQHATIVAALAVGIVQIIATSVGVILIDLLGRKVLLLGSSIGMFIGSLLLGVHFVVLNRVCDGCLGSNCTVDNTHYISHDSSPCDSTKFGFLAIFSIAFFIMSFSIAWGPIPWVSMSELVPTRVRSVAGGIITFVNWTFASIITLAFSQYAKTVTPEIAWWSFSFVTFIGIFFVIFLLPETKRLGIERIQEYFEEGHIFSPSFKAPRRRL